VLWKDFKAKRADNSKGLRVYVWVQPAPLKNGIIRNIANRTFALALNFIGPLNFLRTVVLCRQTHTIASTSPRHGKHCNLRCKRSWRNLKGISPYVIPLASIKTAKKRSGYSRTYIKCIRLGAVRLNHIPFKMHYVCSSLHVFAPTGK